MLTALTVFGPVSPVTVKSTTSSTSVVKSENVLTETVLIDLIPVVFLGVFPLIVTACVSLLPRLV